MSEINAADVVVVVRDALKAKFGDNADPYEDDPFRFGVSFPDGTMVDVTVERSITPTTYIP